MSARSTFAQNFTFLVVISSTVHRSLQSTDHGYPFTEIANLISEEIFTPSIPLVSVLLQRRKTKLTWK